MTGGRFVLNINKRTKDFKKEKNTFPLDMRMKYLPDLAATRPRETVKTMAIFIMAG